MVSEYTPNIHKNIRNNLILQVGILGLFVVALVDTPDKVMEVVSIEFLNILLLYTLQDPIDRSLTNQGTKLGA